MAIETISDDDLIAALQKYGSNRKAASAIGLNVRTVERRRSRLAHKGYSPEHGLNVPYPDGFFMGKVTIQRGRHGEIKNTWERMCADDERLAELMREGIAAMVASLPKLPKRKPLGEFNAQLMACYPLGDPHVGMRAWADECGQSWDLDIAERVHCGVMDDLVKRAPPTQWAVIVNLGDLFHYDSQEAKTPRSGHPLDADGRYAKMVHVGIKIIRQCIESALTKHEFVRVINAPGNHDETGALFLAAALSHIYANEPRVVVDTTPSVFTYFEFGRVLVGIHHGHTCKPSALPGVMAADRPEAWGRAKHRYWWMGHIHHESVKEFPGVLVESFGTLAVRDAYATQGGWRSREQAKCIVLHADLGEVSRLTSHPAMLEAA